MKNLILATILALANTAGAQANTPAAAMTQFCSDLQMGGLMNAIVNMTAPDASADERSFGLEMAEALTGMEGSVMKQMTSRSRCEVVNTSGNTLTIRTAGPNAQKVMEAIFADKDALLALMRIQNSQMDEQAAQMAMMKVVAQYYANPSIPLKTGTGQVVMEKDGDGYWQISDQSMDGFLDALLGGLSQLK